LKRLGILIFTASFLFSQAALASSAESKAEAELLLDGMKMQETIQQSMEQMLNIQLKQNPTLAPYKDVMLKFLSKHMSYKNLKPKLIELYAEAFTASELKDINDFYATPTGKKTIRVLPQLMAKGGQIGGKLVKDNIQELQAMIKAEAERLQKLEAK